MSISTDVRAGSRIGQRLAKAPTGIRGFDEVTDGGLPRGRPTLVTGASGSGKTVFGIEEDGVQLRPEGGQGA
jgi:RecA/RadA recombinase